MEPVRVHSFDFEEKIVEIARITGQGEKMDVFHGVRCSLTLNFDLRGVSSIRIKRPLCSSGYPY
jgi:hypothetical protein